MKLVVLLTDWGTKSYYQGVVKGVIKKVAPEVEVIDLTHEVEPFNVREAMHVLVRAYQDFPPGTVFMAVVDYGVGTERKAIAFETESGYFFVGPDNGLFTLVAEEDKILRIVELENPEYFYKPIPSSSFHGRDIFAPVSAYLAKGVDLSAFGRRLEGLVLLPYEKARKENGEIIGEVAFFDRFGNVETNIPGILLKDLKFFSTVTIKKDGGEFVATYCRTYGDVAEGELLIHTDSSGFLEIAVNQGNAREKLKLQGGERIAVLCHRWGEVS
ncbi:SAM hydrolase/SAM-dependent halogenase family protein [Candidatus Caldatribacterium sp. SIUC1]|uniref:SAM hydrolase/SAM-dependent halogenase family protein n=1 Tax=Candidatus Caldatribacterium sp. SIUC1 TaxID=3418365 RepID=UPI003F692E22